MDTNLPAIVYSDGIGDTLMSLPTLRSLCSIFRNRVSFVGSLHSLQILRNEGLGSKYIDRGGCLADVARALHDRDVLITADPDTTAHFSRQLKQLFRPRLSVGWSSHDQIRLARRSDRHFLDEVFQVAVAFGETRCIEELSFPPRLRPSDRKFGAELRDEMKRYRLLAVHGETAEAKMWSPRSFRIVVEELLEAFQDLFVVVLGRTPAVFQDIAKHPRVIDSVGVDLGKAMAIVRFADAFLGVDSGLLHTADFFRVPSVGIFGPTDPTRWGCRFADTKHLRAPSGDLRRLSEQEVTIATCAMLKSICDDI